MSTNTYAGLTIKAVAGKPATNDATGFAALTFVGGEASIRQAPAAGRMWNTASDNLVDSDTNVDVKASAKYMPMDFSVALKKDHAMHAILRTLEESRTAVGSFEITLPGSLGTIYVQAQVAKFDEFSGGGQDDIIDAAVQLLPQAAHIHVDAP